MLLGGIFSAALHGDLQTVRGEMISGDTRDTFPGAHHNDIDGDTHRFIGKIIELFSFRRFSDVQSHVDLAGVHLFRLSLKLFSKPAYSYRHGANIFMCCSISYA